MSLGTRVTIIKQRNKTCNRYKIIIFKHFRTEIENICDVPPSLSVSNDGDDPLIPKKYPPSSSTGIKKKIKKNKKKTDNDTNKKKSPPPIKKTKIQKNKLVGEPKTEFQSMLAGSDPSNGMRIVEATWRWNYENLVKYHVTHGNSNVLRSDPNKQLSGWVKRQRNNLKDGKLSPCKILLLNKLDFVWNRIDGKWYEKFNRLVRFQNEFKHCDVTTKYDRSLAEWTQRQRREYKNGISTMTFLRIRKLEALHGWSWEKLKFRKEAAHHAILGTVVNNVEPALDNVESATTAQINTEIVATKLPPSTEPSSPAVQVQAQAQAHTSDTSGFEVAKKSPPSTEPSTPAAQVQAQTSEISGFDLLFTASKLKGDALII